MLNIIPLPIFDDNYIWIVERDRRTVAIDPGDAATLIDWLDTRGYLLDAVLITHHHHDHTGGLPTLHATWPTLPVYGPAHIVGVNQALHDGDTVSILGACFNVIATPGHTLDHLCYYGAGALFCGDTLFAGGCGRLFEGTPAQMLTSLTRLAHLPDDTQVYCTHEYTLANLKFAQVAEADNDELGKRIAVETIKRARNQPTLPSTIELEKATNPYLRCTEPVLIASALAHGANTPDPLAVFTALRSWKNSFR